MAARRRIRLLWILGLLSAVAIFVIATVGTAQGPQRARYESDVVSFSYPSGWSTSIRPGFFHYEPLVFVSNEKLGTPCSTVGDTTTCRWPVETLLPHGVIAAWFMNPVPVVGPLRAPGQETKIGGHRALLRTQRHNPACTRIGGQLEIDATLTSPSFNFQACLRGPELGKTRNQILALLASTEFGR